MLAILLEMRADHSGSNEAGGAGGKMDDIAAREIGHPRAGEPPATPPSSVDQGSTPPNSWEGPSYALPPVRRSPRRGTSTPGSVNFSVTSAEVSPRKLPWFKDTTKPRQPIFKILRELMLRKESTVAWRAICLGFAYP